VRKLEWFKNSLDWVIRLQGAYTILATILAGGAGTLLRALLRYYTKVPALWATPIWLAFAAAVLAVLFAWGGRLGTFVNYPEFELELNTIIWIYNPKEERTIFYIGSRLLNRGAPSIALGWTAEYVLGDEKEEMKGFYLTEPSILTVGAERLTVENKDLLTVKTAEKAVERGGAIYGRLVFALPGDRNDQVKTLQFRIKVTVEDYTRRKCTGIYVPSSKPMASLLRHPFEKGEFIKEPEAAAEIAPAAERNEAAS